MGSGEPVGYEAGIFPFIIHYAGVCLFFLQRGKMSSYKGKKCPMLWRICAYE